MGRKPVSMRKAGDILRLRYDKGLGVRQIARSLGISHGTVVNYLRRAEAAGIGWPPGEGVDEEALERLLFSTQKPAAGAPRSLPSMSYLHRELRRGKGATLRLLWEEYRREHPEGYGYTQFCEYYRRFRSGVEPALRQEHKAGDKLFVDWAGETIPVVEPGSGTVRQAHLLVAALGASNYTPGRLVPPPGWTFCQAQRPRPSGNPQLGVASGRRTERQTAGREDPSELA